MTPSICMTGSHSQTGATAPPAASKTLSPCTCKADTPFWREVAANLAREQFTGPAEFSVRVPQEPFFDLRDHDKNVLARIAAAHVLADIDSADMGDDSW